MSAHAFDAAEAERIVADEMAQARAFYGEDAGGAAPLLPILHAMQEAFGHIPAHAQPLIASRLNISQAEVRGVVSFYHDFRAAPAGRHVLKLCRAEACQARGCERVAAHLERAHALAPGATTADGSLTLESVYCLGDCALGPAALLDDRLIGRIDEARVDELVLEARR
ncbi:MAG: fdh2C [Hyphomicrobiales bacterium]|nr:fdh2C [Hyphomicrobiales bacterium]